MNLKELRKNLNGLTTEQVVASKESYGDNSLTPKKTATIWEMLIGALNDICIKILLIALAAKVVMAVLGIYIPELKGESDLVEIISVFSAAMLATGLSVLSEYRNTTRSSALQEEYSKTFAKVMRNGEMVVIPTNDIVKDDIVLLQSGDKVPVDGLIIKGKIKVSQAALNGESRDENKSEADNLDDALSTDFNHANKVFMGSVVESGEAYMIATVLGDKTELGKINLALNDAEEDERKDATSLKLEVLLGQINKLGMICAILVGIIHVTMAFVGKRVEFQAASLISLGLEAVMLAVTILIMAIPEGLATVVNLIQSMNTENLYKSHILVSHKANYSDSAFLNMLFTDKTGTITYGKLSLVEWLDGLGKVNKGITPRLIEAITINNLAKVSEGKAIGSNNMDRALLDYAIENGFKETHIDLSKIKEIYGFDSEKKCATVDMIDGSTYWKGATEAIIDEITHYADGNEDFEFNSGHKEKLQEVMKKQTSRAMKLLSVVKIEKDKKILLAVLCLRDDVREDAKKTVKTLKKAGIQVVMVTGDNIDTAVAIAKEARILTNELVEKSLTHEQLEDMTDDELKEELHNIKVIARAKPLDKQRLVRIAQALGHVVGMSGDGVNDAPALKQADIGFAMGDGTAVAQEAGDVVILNNSLTSIKDCVLNSRTMAKSIGKFLIFQLTVNVSMLMMNIISPILGILEPFSIVEILWINLIMDTLCALSYSEEPLLDRYMEERPVNRKDNILTKYMKSSIGFVSLFITVVSILILKGQLVFLFNNYDSGDMYIKTLMFSFYVYAVIFNSLNTRSENLNLFERIRDNMKFVYIMGGVFIFQTLIIQFGGAVFGTVQLDIKELLTVIAISALVIPIDMFKKILYKKIAS